MSARRALAVAGLLTAVLSPVPASAPAAAPPSGAAALPSPAWIFFRDRGASAECAPAEELRRRGGRLDARALDRRRRARGESRSPVEASDLPPPEGYLAALENAGARLRARSSWLNAASVEAGPEALRRIAGLPFVREIRPVRCGRPPTPRRASALAGEARDARRAGDPLDPALAGPQLAQIGIPALHELGLDGGGIRIAVLDAGFDVDSDVFRDLTLVAAWDFVHADSVVADEPGEAGAAFHGTLVLSLLAGRTPAGPIGPAFAAEYLLAKTEDPFDERPAEEDYWVAGLEWAESMGADIVSSSLGYFDFPGYPGYAYEDLDGETAVTTIAADAAAERGVLVVVSAGNRGGGPASHVNAPADGRRVAAIGAVTPSGARAAFSSRGPTADGRVKPDLAAPGQSVWGLDVAAVPHALQPFDGTSMATPLAAGAAALLMQAHDELRGQPGIMLSLLRATASQSCCPDQDLGWGLLDAVEALARAETPAGTGGEARTGAIAAWPVPGRAPFTVRYLARDLCALRREATLLVADARGRLVRRLRLAPLADGTGGGVVWDGRDERGARVASGVYLLRAEGDPEARGRVVLLR